MKGMKRTLQTINRGISKKIKQGKVSVGSYKPNKEKNNVGNMKYIKYIISRNKTVLERIGGI